MRKILAIVIVLVGGGLFLAYQKYAHEQVYTLHSIQTFLMETKEHRHWPLHLTTREVTFADGSSTILQLAEGFSIDVAAEDMGKARMMSKSPDGRLFVPDMVNWNDNTQGSVYILEDFDPETKKFQKKSTYLENLRNPNSLAFYQDDSEQWWLYIALTDRLIRYRYAEGDDSPSGEAEIIMRFPDYRTVDGDVWHITRTILFYDNKLFVSVGSSCNICEEPEDEIRAEIVVSDPEGNEVRSFAKGLRNAVGIAMRNGQLYATNNGADHLGPDDPDDVIHVVEEGVHYGFPYCYETGGELHFDRSWSWQQEPLACGEVPKAFVSLGPHTAPIGITYIGNQDPYLGDSFLVALRGSHQVELRQGYNVTRVLPNGQQDVFIEGFLKENNERVGRPVHVLAWDEKTYFLTDDHEGKIYMITAE